MRNVESQLLLSNENNGINKRIQIDYHQRAYHDRWINITGIKNGPEEEEDHSATNVDTTWG